MPYIEWSDALSVNIREIDDDHRRIIGSINRLHQAMLDNRGKELQKEIIYELYDYAHSHFALEEQYMKRFRFPGYAEHRQEHEEFVREATDLKARVERGGLILTAMILSFLRDWLQNHILGTDMKYVEHFKRHGLV